MAQGELDDRGFLFPGIRMQHPQDRGGRDQRLLRAEYIFSDLTGRRFGDFRLITKNTGFDRILTGLDEQGPEDNERKDHQQDQKKEYLLPKPFRQKSVK